MNATLYTDLFHRIPLWFVQQQRALSRIPLWEYHTRFDQTVGKKLPCPDVLDRFKRLNNGVWIRTYAGRHKRRYLMPERKAMQTSQHIMCSKLECEILDKLVTRFWQRPKYYVGDPYAAYHIRHGINTPRVDYKKRFVRERPKILLDDSTADQYFRDR